MRKGILFAVLIGLLTLPVLAQFPGGGFRGMDGSALLSSPDVQKELKLTDEQKAAVKKATDARMQAFRDRDQEAAKKASEELTKVYKELKPEQKKRLLSIEVQVAEKTTQPRIFANPDVQKALKLTDEQKKDVKELMSDMEKDVKELFEDAKGDKEKATAAFRKLRTMSKETYEKISKKLSEEQKTALKELKGEEFKGNVGFGGGRPGKGKREKKDDI